MSAPLLEARAVTKRFVVRAGTFRRTALTAVADASLRVGPGETLGVVGESGSGKSTLGRMLVGLLRPDAGTVRLAGSDLAAMPRHERRLLPRSVQMVFQDPYSALNPRMSIGGNVAYPMRIQGHGRRAARERTAELLTEVGLHPHHASSYPHQLSGGQLQRVNIARALALRPRVVVCDEAVSALDKSVQAQILNLLRDLQDAHGLAYVFISHDLNVVEYMSDHVLVMYRGHVVESCEADQLYADPRHPYSRLLLSSVPSLDPDARTSAPLTAERHAAATPDGCPFVERCPEAMPVCGTRHPQLGPVALGHAAACHLHPLLAGNHRPDTLEAVDARPARP